MATIPSGRLSPSQPPDAGAAADPTDRERVALLVALLATLAISFSMSSQESPQLSDLAVLDLVAKKAGHLGGYALLGALLVATIRAWTPRTRRLGAITSALGSPGRLALLLAFAWAISDEIHQSRTPGRTALPTDVLIDTVGAAIGIFVARRVLEVRRRL